MNTLPHDHIKPYSDEPVSKKEQVEQMFDRIAGRYDFINHLLSAGIDQNWRRIAIKKLRKDDPKLILDVATGTGDMALLCCRILNPQKVVGIDISSEMLELGRKKVEKEGFSSKIELLKGDAEAINFPDNSFDSVLAAFGVRNFENLPKGLNEMKRILKPGGRLIILEFSRPKRTMFRSLYNLYMDIVAPEVAQWFKQNKQAYKYLNQSTNAFPDQHQFEEILHQTGFTEVHSRPLSFGICCIYSGRKF